MSGEYLKQPADSSRKEECLRFWVLVSRSLPLDPQAAAVGLVMESWENEEP